MVVPLVRRAAAAVKGHGARRAAAAHLLPAVPAAPAHDPRVPAHAVRAPTATRVAVRLPVAVVMIADPDPVEADPNGVQRLR